MATTTPNYGWTVPTSTDLVKDGATAIETLGDAIDASMNTALGTKKAGLVLINTTSFSAVSAASLPAATFSATYDDYRIIFKLTAGTQTTNMRLRVGGADNTTSNYANQIYFGAYTNSSANTGGTGTTSWPNSGAGELTVQTIDIYSPFATANTSLHTIYTHDGNAGLRLYQFRATTSFDSLTVFPTSGTISGSFAVYGYNK